MAETEELPEDVPLFLKSMPFLSASTELCKQVEVALKDQDVTDLDVLASLSEPECGALLQFLTVGNRKRFYNGIKKLRLQSGLYEDLRRRRGPLDGDQGQLNSGEGLLQGSTDRQQSGSRDGSHPKQRRHQSGQMYLNLLKQHLPLRSRLLSTSQGDDSTDNDSDNSAESSVLFNKKTAINRKQPEKNGSAQCMCSHCPSCAPSGKGSLHSTGLKPERWKTLLAFGYLLLVSWLSAFIMVIVHDRVPDMEKYPPLPDLLLDNLPHIPWAFEMCELTGMMLLLVWSVVCLFHKHRFILLRRFFSISGTIFLLRCVTMLITSLSVPGRHLSCAPRPYGNIWNKLYNAYVIWTGAGMTLQGVRTCGDYMFSGHTVSLTLLNFFITEYTSRRIFFLHTFTWICNVFGVFFILAAHEHYSIDVFIAFYISSRLFLYYHTLANNSRILGSNKSSNSNHRAYFYFPLFFFFEKGSNGKIPNEFECPITFDGVKQTLILLQRRLGSLSTVKFNVTEDIIKKEK